MHTQTRTEHGVATHEQLQPQENPPSIPHLLQRAVHKPVQLAGAGANNRVWSTPPNAQHFLDLALGAERGVAPHQVAALQHVKCAVHVAANHHRITLHKDKDKDKDRK
jgi:hypothetical protein